MKNDDVFIILPTLNPNEQIMLKFINELCLNFSNIIVVNDGSNKKYDNFFETLKKKDVTVLKHCINLGKGRALKTATNYILNQFPECKVIITADSDGQHSVDDIKSCAKVVLKNPKCLVLGTRDFSKSNVPIRSRFGNVITRNIFRLFVGLSITDTQTGLRGMTPEIATEFMETSGERYEYESNVLIECKERDIPIFEVSIETIYLNNNVESHFNPVSDSIKIYKLFANYIIKFCLLFILDIVIFWLLLKNVYNNILYATFISRIILLLVRSLGTEKRISGLLECVKMVFSGLIVYGICFQIYKPVLVKIIVDLLIFIFIKPFVVKFIHKKNNV